MCHASLLCSLKCFSSVMNEAAAHLTAEMELLWRSGIDTADMHQLAGDLSFDVIALLGLG